MAKPDISVAALMSCPRIGWTDSWSCIEASLRAFAIPLWRAGGPWWHHGMDSLFARAVELGLEWVLTLDYDSVMIPAHLERLFDLMRNRPDIDALAPVEADLDGLAIAGGLEGDRLPMDGWPVQVEMAHFGCTVIRVQAIRETPRPWFREQTDSQGGYEGNDKCDADAAFWKAFRDSGHRAYIATDVRIGHVSAMVKSILANGRYHVEPIHRWIERQVQEFPTVGLGVRYKGVSHASTDSEVVRQPCAG